ncbi:hypothetical protein SAMN04488136_12847 [Vibrio xiamenensis]|uniref:Immunity MXAN-0049 protein domain-containing protein n=1 Tax=Vibrio xiamenensis TaxID=861298 RepID=A0A1G8F448_9VIBR|nr:DUF1629 domain-containing protein [Vibrio xiamenensis]SDH76923.1 hypothetical protein SAMN04488136_12847 [Vibrio xiamenensis]
MNIYNEQYYILKSSPFKQKFLELKPSTDTARRNHTFERLDYADGAVFFENAFRGDIPFYLTNGQFDGIYPVVSSDIADALSLYEIRGFQLFPAVIMDDSEKWHEDFYFFNFYEKFDVVDFEKSIVSNYKPNSKYNEVIKFTLDADILDSINEEERLIIDLARVEGGSLIFHEKIVNLLSRFEIEAFQFFKLSEYELGMEFR